MSTLFVSDLDGTLLDRTGELSARTRAGVLDLLERGVPFTVASARSLISMRDLLGPLPLPLPVACLNGGTISDLATGEHLVVHGVPLEVAADVVERARSHRLELMMGAITDAGERVWVPRRHSQGMAVYVEDRQGRGDPRIRLVDDVVVGLQGQITTLTVIGRREPSEMLAAELRTTYADQLDVNLVSDFYTPGWMWLTAHAARATKGHAVRALIDDHAPSTARLVVFGDQLNDIPMFEQADHAVATENAVPELKALAHEVIGHHHDDAVVEWLLRNA